MEITVKLEAGQRQQLCDEIVSAILAKMPVAQFTEPDRKLTRAEAAKALHVTEVTIDEYRRNGLLPFQKLGARVFFKHSDIVNAGTKARRHIEK